MPATSVPTSVTYRTSARLLGAANAGLSIIGSVVLAIGLSELARHRVNTGIWLLLGTLGIRWGLSTLTTQWGEHAGAELRAHWRSILVRHFTRPQPEGGRGRRDLALAIERASTGPHLEVLETSAVVALGGLAVLFWAGGWLTLVITVVLLMSAVPLYRRAGQRSDAAAADYQRRRDVLEIRQLELLHHTTELRALGAVPFGANEIAAISDSEHVFAMRAIRIALGSSLVTEFLSGVSVGLVAMVVGFALLGGRISLEHALIAVLVTSEIFAHVRRYGVEFHRREDADRSLELLDGPSPAPVEQGTALMEVTGLTTPANDRPVSFALRAGESLLVTGASGVGKTTLLDTLVGWRDPNGGTLARAAIRVGHVSVDSTLLSGTLRDNLSLGRPIPDVDILACLASLGLNGARFEDLDTILLSDGRGISTGEKVRLVLARALLADSELLVIDDVAGVLDDEGRRLVRDVLERHALAAIESTVDTPLLRHVNYRIELTP